MCHLLTIGVSDYSGDPKEIFRAQGLDTAPPANPYVRAALPDGAVLFDVTKSGCSCSVYRGSDLGSVFDESAERARYARKGWSNAKITRAVETKRIAHERRPPDLLRQQFCRGVELIRHAGASIALISHNYSGLFAEEAVSIGSRSQMSLQEFTAKRGAFPEDILVTIE